MIEGAIQIAKDTFDERKVRFTRVMHVKTDLLDSVSNVRVSESSILECTGKATVMRMVG